MRILLVKDERRFANFASRSMRGNAYVVTAWNSDRRQSGTKWHSKISSISRNMLDRRILWRINSLIFVMLDTGCTSWLTRSVIIPFSLDSANRFVQNLASVKSVTSKFPAVLFTYVLQNMLRRAQYSPLARRRACCGRILLTGNTVLRCQWLSVNERRHRPAGRLQHGISEAVAG